MNVNRICFAHFLKLKIKTTSFTSLVKRIWPLWKHRQINTGIDLGLQFLHIYNAVMCKNIVTAMCSRPFPS